MKRRVVITGLGLVSPCGTGVEPFWDALISGTSGIGPITHFDATSADTRIAGEVKGFDATSYMDRKSARRMSRFQQLAMAAAHLAIEDGSFTCPPRDPERAAVIIGTSVGGLITAEEQLGAYFKSGISGMNPFFILQLLGNMLPAYVSIRWGFRGMSMATNSACATGSHAIGEAFRLIQHDEADVALAGGAEAPIAMLSIAGFNNLRALSTRNDDPAAASRPFDRDRDGFVMSEGAGVLLLEELEYARNRGARIYAELAGYGTSSDAYHVTAPSPGHEGGQRCMRNAIRNAGMDAADIGYINAHAPSTPVGDLLELEAIQAVFGANTRAAVSSTKSMTGHMIGAAGAVETAITALTIQRGVMPPSINLDNLEFQGDINYVRNVARTATVDAALTNSFGFGGTNASLVLRRLVA